MTLYVLVTVWAQTGPLVTSLTNATTMVPEQLSASVVTARTSTGGILPHATVTGAGFEAVGGVVSNVRTIVCVHVAVLPHSSVALYVLVVVSVQPVVTGTSPT